MTEWQAFLETINQFINGMINFLNYIPMALGYITSVLLVMPVELKGFMICVATASIVLLIVGRNSSS